MSKTINNVKLSADFKIASTCQQLWDSTATDQTANQSINVSNALGIIAKWLADLGTAAFNDTGDFATSGHTHALSGTGSDHITGILPVSKGGTGVDTLTSGQVLIGNGQDPVSTRAISTSVGTSSTSTNLITEGAIVKKGYVTSSGVTSITPGDGIVNGSGTTAAITSTGTLKAALANYTKATIAADTGSTATAGRYYPVALDKNGKMAVAVPWTTPVTSVAGRTGPITLTHEDIGGLGTAATANTESTLTNGSNLPTGAAITTYVSNQIGALGNILTFKGVVAAVSDLPTTGNKIGDVYFVGTNTTTSKDDFTEYVWAEVSSGTYEWEYLGKVHVNPDLSNYLTAVEFNMSGTTNDAVKLEVKQTKNNGTATRVAELTLPTADTTKYGVTKLSSATNSTSITLAATASAVKSAYDRAAVYNSAVSTTGSGNAVTGVKITSGQIVATKGATFLTEHPEIPTTDDTPETPAQLSHGGTFTAITGVTRDANGHVTTLNTATYKLPASGNTDTKVTQNVSATTVTDTYPLLISAYKTGTTTTTASTVSRIQSIYAQPSTGTINATQFVGGGSGLTGLTASQIDGLNDAIDARRGVTSITADSNGLTGGTITSTGTIGLSLKSTTKLNIDSVAAVTTGTTNKVYPVLLDKSGKLSVNVPWTDTNTKVNVVTRGTTKAYLLGTTTSPTSTATGVTAVAETGVYFDTTAGKLVATTFVGALDTTTTATTQATGNSSTRVATTAFVHQDAICNGDTDVIINCVPDNA